MVAQVNGNGQQQQAVSNKPVAEQYRELLATDPRLALELAIAESERAKARITEEREVTIAENGTMDFTTMTGLLRAGKFYADSQVVPDTYQGKPNDCAIILQLAKRLKIDAMMAFQNIYIVYGRPALSGQLYTAILNASDETDGRIAYEFKGAGAARQCTASIKDRHGTLHSATVTWETVESEGWHKEKKGQKSKWVTIPDQMFKYRSAAFLARGSFPDLVMGLHTLDEMEDVFGPVETTRREQPAVSGLLQQILSAPPVEVESAPVQKTKPVADEPAKTTETAEVAKESTEAKETPGKPETKTVEETVPSAADSKPEPTGEPLAISRFRAAVGRMRSVDGIDKHTARMLATDSWSEDDVREIQMIQEAAKKELLGTKGLF